MSAEQLEETEAPDDGLTMRQRLFVVAFVGEAQGRPGQAAKLAGYKGSSHNLAVQAHKLRKNPKIQAAIEAAFADDPRVATKHERVAFLTSVMRGEGGERTRDRLAAAEQLAKISGDHVTKVAQTDASGNDLAALSDAELDRRIRELETGSELGEGGNVAE